MRRLSVDVMGMVTVRVRLRIRLRIRFMAKVFVKVLINVCIYTLDIDILTSALYPWCGGRRRSV